MGKYMRKAKITGEVAVMDVSHQSPLGVRTRARTRTLALQRLKRPSPDPPSPASSYLQLRSRRLEKLASTPPPPAKPCKESPTPTATPDSSSPKSSPGPRVRAARVNSSSVSMRSCSVKAAAAAASEAEADGGIEVSFGENVLEIENRDRNARETTPCSLIRDSETIRTPGSTTRPTNSTAYNRRPPNSMPRNIPTAHEMEEFFAVAEQLQQRIFMEKYNFDPVNDQPLLGRYEWVKLDL